MMWSTVILLLLAGAAFADPQYGWRDGKEYTYKIRSRTLASYNPQAKQYAGILMKAYLIVQANGPETLRAKVENPHYSQVHTHLENGWDSEIPENQLNLQAYPLSGKPFEIKMKNGVIRDLVVDKDVPTWEVNVLKSIVSQLQVDTHGENAEKSEHNQFPEGKQPYALFKTMEDTVGGKCEVLYDISPLPEHVLQSNAELAPLPDFREDGDFISIVKTKNYSHCDQRVGYHHGINGRNNWEPGANDNGRYLTRSTVSRVVISGDLRKYAIQSSVTTNKVVLNPTQRENHHGVVVSRMNVTIHEVKDISDQVLPPSNPQSTGNLVYSYNRPSENVNSRRPSRLSHSQHSYHFNSKSNSNRRQNNNEKDSDESNSSSSVYDNEGDSYLQPKPKLTEAPEHPMLSYFIGNNGNSIQKDGKVDAVKSAKNIAQEIGNEIQKPDTMPEEETLEKYTILYKLIRTMSVDQIAEVQRELYEQQPSSNQLNQNNPNQNARRYAWVAYRDAVAKAGTGPALVNIKQWIQNKQIEGFEAAFVIDTLGKSTQTPTPEFLDAYFELIKSQECKKHHALRESSVLSFSDLIRYSVVNKRSAHNRYPVHAFGRFFTNKDHNVEEKYLPYLKEELDSAVKNGDSQKIQLYSAAIGRTGHSRILSIFEPYIEGKKQISTYQRLFMVLSMYNLAKVHPKLARSVFYKMYSNTADYHEIRTVSVYMLIATNPPVSMLQRIADYTNYDSSKHVNSAVKSMIESLAQLQDEEYREMADAARAAVPLLTSESYGSQYSRSFYTGIKNSLTNSGFEVEGYTIGSDDSIIPKAASVAIHPVFLGLKTPKVELMGVVSSVQNIWNFVQQKLLNEQKNTRNSQKNQQQKYSPENVAKLLGIHGKDPEQIEGAFYLNNERGSFFYAFDNHTIEQIPERLRELEEAMKKGMSYDFTRFSDYEVNMAFPTETGYPFQFTYEMPTFVSVRGYSKTTIDRVGNDRHSVPSSVNVSSRTRAFVGTKIQKRFGFITPFERQEYLAGIDKNMQIYLPMRSQFEYDKSKQTSRLQVQPNEDEGDFKALQYRTQPFTAKHDIMSLKPVSNDRSTHIIHKDRVSHSHIEFNDNNNKQIVQFQWSRTSNRPSEESDSRQEKYDNAMNAGFKLACSVSSLFLPNAPEETEYENYVVKVSSSNDLIAEVRVSHEETSSENTNNYDEANSSPHARAPHLEKSLSENERKQKLLREASKNINSAKAKALDISLQVNGGLKSSIVATAAYGQSNVDEKERVLFYASANIKDGQDYHVSAALESKIPHAHRMDYEETLKTNNRQEYDAVIHYGKGSGQSGDKYEDQIRIQGKVKQTEQRKNSIRRSHDAQACNKQIEQSGDKITSACEKVNRNAESLDAADITIHFEDGSPLNELVMSALDMAHDASQSHFETSKSRSERSEKNTIKVGVEVTPNGSQMEMTIQTPEGQIRVSNIKLPSHYSKSNTDKEGYKDTQNSESKIFPKNVCALDKSLVKSFDNHRYGVQLGKCWHVAMTSYPKNDPDRPSQQEQVPDHMHVSVLIKESDDGRKELKITLGDKEVELKSKGTQENQAKVDGKDVEYSQHQAYQETNKGKIIFEIYEQSDKSVTVDSKKYNVRITYDGQRAEVEAGDRYRDSVRGLCGNYDSEPENDQQTPKGCNLQNPQEFSATYALTNEDQCQGPALKNLERSRNSACLYESIHTGNVISDEEAGRKSSSRRNGSYNSEESSDNDYQRCIKHRTMVVKSDNEICFSLRPVPSCSSSCSPTSTKNKNIQFHCVPRTSAAEKVAERVEKGANPDLSQKVVSKIESRPVPISCRA